MTTFENISEIYSRAQKNVDSDLQKFLESTDLCSSLKKAANYAVLSKGKRVRPALAMQCAVACGGNEQNGLIPASAIELVHAFSLVHDDLPALDNDELRRGLPTVHKKYGEAMAILVGDLLLSLAFKRITTSSFTTEIKAFMINELSEATAKMVSGQVLDTLEKEEQDKKILVQKIHTQKTESLISAACIMGARSTTNDLEKITYIKEYGQAIGLAYQIMDDLIDLEGSTEKAGKRVKKDEIANKCTWPLAYGVEESKREVKKLLEISLNAIKPLGNIANGLIVLAKSLTYRTH